MGIKKAIIIIFCTFHAVILISHIIPSGRLNAERGFGRKLLDSYHSITSTPQDWTMFATVHTLHAINATVKADNGKIYGPVLPGAKPMDIRKYQRLSYGFPRLLNENNGPVQNQFILNLKDNLQDSGARFFTFQVDRELTRHLFHVAKDGKLYKTISYTLGPFAIDNQ